MDAPTAEEIMSIDLGEAFRARFKNPYAVVHRGDLHKILLQACSNQSRIELGVNSEVVCYEQDDTSVTARLTSGEGVNGSLLASADGLWSNIRKKLVGDGPPRVSGQLPRGQVGLADLLVEDFISALHSTMQEMDGQRVERYLACGSP